MKRLIDWWFRVILLDKGNPDIMTPKEYYQEKGLFLKPGSTRVDVNAFELVRNGTYGDFKERKEDWDSKYYS